MNKNDLINFIKNNEETYEGKNHNLKYLFVPNEDSEHLAVILSGFHGKEASGKKPVYNYINTLESINVNKLFILDGVDDVPVYYYGENSEPTYLEDTSSLIKNIAKKAKINLRRVIIGGSSKGGTGALLVGLNMNIGHIISGANQLYVGTYLNRMGPKLKGLMFPKILGEANEDSAQKLDELIKGQLLVNETRSNLYFHGSTRDTHYVKHMKPLLEYYDSQEIIYELDLRNYIGHNSVVYYFPNYLKNKINEILNLPKIKTPKVTIVDQNVNVLIDVSHQRRKTFNYRVYLYLKSGKVLQSRYKNDLNHSFKVDINQIKSIKVFLKEFEILRDVRLFSMKSILQETNDK